MQKPLVHCVPTVQVEPSATVPHELFTHGCPTQSLADAQVFAHAVPPVAHLNGAHVTELDGLQAPRPSHAEPLTTALLDDVQTPPPHAVPLGQSSQAPFPSHLPSSPQDAAVAAVHAA